MSVFQNQMSEMNENIIEISYNLKKDDKARRVRQSLENLLSGVQKVIAKRQPTCGSDLRSRRHSSMNRPKFSPALHDASKALFELFWAYGRWIRNSFGDECPHLTDRLVRIFQIII